MGQETRPTPVEEAVLAVVVAMLLESQDEKTAYAGVKVREVWPKPSAWRWAPIGQY